MIYADPARNKTNNENNLLVQLFYLMCTLEWIMMMIQVQRLPVPQDPTLL